MMEYNCQHFAEISRILKRSANLLEGDEGDQQKLKVAISDVIEASDRLRINEGQQPARDWGPKISRALHHLNRDLYRHKLLQRKTSLEAGLAF